MKKRLLITVLFTLFALGISGQAFAVQWGLTRLGAFGAGTSPASVVAADFNGDGIPDIAVADRQTDGKMNVILGKPGGKFGKAKAYPAGDTPVAITAADFNEDGILDLAVADWTSGEFRIFIGNGDGTFKKPSVADGTIITGLGKNPVHVRAADLGNGHQDLVFADFNDKSISVALGNGDGTFQAPASITVGTNPRHVCIGDFNGDGKPDIAVTLWGDGNVATLLGNGDGTFQAPVTFAAGINPLAVETADLDGDGKLDLVVDLFKKDKVAIFMGDGDGTFSVPSAPANAILNGSSGVQEIVLQDFDGDGRTDIAVAASGANAIDIFLNRGDGTFQNKKSFVAGAYPAALASANFDKTGLPGLVSGDFSDNKVSVYRPQTTSVGFWSYTTIPSVSLTAGTTPTALLADDLDYDGVVDIAVANKDSNNITVFLNRSRGGLTNFSTVTTPGPGAPVFPAISSISAPTAIASGVFTNSTSAGFATDLRTGLAVTNPGTNTVAVLLPNGGGTFKLPPRILLAGTNPVAIKTADFRKGGKTDIAVCNQGSNSVSVFLGDGKGNFTEASGSPYPVENGPVSMAIGDFNKDGKPDIAVANRDSGTISILTGKGNGTFNPAKSYPAGTQPSSIATTPSGNLVVSNGDNTAHILSNNGTGAFTFGTVAGKTSFDVGTSPAGILGEDVTDDRRVDIVTANSGSDSVTLISGKATGGFNDPVSFPAGTGPVALAAHDFNGDGATDLAVADSDGKVTLLFGRDIATLTVNINDPTMGTVDVTSNTGTQTVSAASATIQVEGGREVKLTANPKPGFKFVRWTGDLTGSKNPGFLTLLGAKKKITVVFAISGGVSGGGGGGGAGGGGNVTP